MGCLTFITCECIFAAVAMFLLPSAVALQALEEVGTPLPDVCDDIRGDKSVQLQGVGVSELSTECPDDQKVSRFFFHPTKHCKKFGLCQPSVSFLDTYYLNQENVSINYFEHRAECEQACTNVVKCLHQPLENIENGYPVIHMVEEEAGEREEEEEEVMVSGEMDMLTYGYGTVASFECNEGYGLIAVNRSTTRTCQLSGTWSGAQPLCAIQCSKPELTDQEISISPSKPYYNVGEQIQLECMDGFEGGTTWTCEQEAVWSGLAPTCSPTCPPPPVDNAHPPMKEEVGEVIYFTYTCHDGYSLLYDHSQLSCTGGTLEGVTPICTRVMIEPCSNDTSVMQKNGTYYIEEGAENVVFKCHLEGLEDNLFPIEWLETDKETINVTSPEIPGEWIPWRKPTGEGPPGVDTEGKSLTFHRANPAQTGEFVCNICDLTETLDVEILEPVQGAPVVDYFDPSGVTKTHRGEEEVLESLTTGSQPLTVTWQHNGSNINMSDPMFILYSLPTDDATYSTLTINSMAEVTQGEYKIVANNLQGQTVSEAAQLMLGESGNTQTRLRRSSNSHFCEENPKKVVLVGVVRRTGRTQSGLESIKLRVVRVLRGDTQGISLQRRIEVRIFSNADMERLRRGQTVVLAGVVTKETMVYVLNTPIENYSTELENEIATC